MIRPIQQLSKHLNSNQFKKRKRKIEKRKLMENIILKTKKRKSVFRWKKLIPKRPKIFDIFDVYIPPTNIENTLKNTKRQPKNAIKS